MYQSPSSINLLPNAILFSFTILLAQFLSTNLASTASPELHFEQFVSRQQFPRSSANDSAELLMAHGRRPPAENSAGFRANCSVPLCEGSLAPIFCSGPLLSSAWFFGVQQQCPGSRLLNEPNVVWSNFKEILRNNTIRKGDFMQFCEDNFETAAYLKPANLSDWLPEPVNFERITDKKMREFASSLHQIWPSLTREFVDDVHENQDRYPVLSVPNRFVVPGGFFKVYFYWDTYWILKGLYFSNLTETALGMLDNFAHVIHHHGFIPNSGNVQLSRRSQPPLFTQMLADYFGHTQNKTFLNHFLPFAEKELEWWHRNRSVEVDVDGQKLRMFQYKTVTDCPRPENFLEDYQLGIQTEDPRFFWSSTASACESGLDFSSRWYKWEGIEELRPREEEEPMSRKQIATNHVLPVDLNVFMALNYETLAKLYGEVLGDKSKSAHFAQLSSQLGSAIDRAFYDKKAGTWFDRDLVQRRLRTKFYPSNIYPLLLKGKQQFCGQAVNYLRGSGALDFKGGIPSSLERDSNEQWDFPNGWAPQQHLFVASLLQCKDSVEAVDIARRVGEAFLKTAFNGLFNPMQRKPAQMWEKYDVRYDNGRSGFGGEYPPQSGFGWTNGVVFEFIRLFYTSENGERLEKRAASSLNVAQDANAQGQLFVLDSLAGFFSTMNHHF